MGIKKALRTGRDQLLSPVLHSDKALEVAVIDLKVRVLKLEEDLQTANDKVLRLLRSIESRTLNSGVIQLPSGEIMTKIFSGAKMYLDPHDIALVPHLVLDGDWERDVTHAWLKTIRDGDVVVDIGANFGYFGVLAAQQTNRQCRIISFEANPSLIPYLKKTFNVNGFDGISTIENLAIADKRGKVTLNILEGYIGSSSAQDVDTIKAYSHTIPDVQIASRVQVEAVSLDEYCQKHHIDSLDLIKMDIEGFEERAYRGMRKIVKASPGLTLFIEFTKEAYESPKKFYEQMLADFGNVYLINADGTLRRPESDGYDSVIGSGSGWVMPVFSKRTDLVEQV